jgi:hypothetical protein
MKRLIGFLLLGSLMVGLGVATAQMSPPKVLVVSREFVKPGKGGAMHDKTESAFVQAFTKAKWPTHYLGMNSLSGKQRSLFFTGYDSFDAWEKDTLAVEKNAALSAALEHAFVADGDLLDSIDGGTFVYDEEYSLRPQPATAATRYFEVSVFRVKAGHHKDWDDAVKMVLAAYQKAVPEMHWACFEVAYGAPDGTYLFLTQRKSASEIDRAIASDKDFRAAMGDEGMKKLEELSAAMTDSSESNLFMLNPKMSYVSEDWIKADPDFWKPKAEAAPAAAPKKPAEKTGTGQ